MIKPIYAVMSSLLLFCVFSPFVTTVLLNKSLDSRVPDVAVINGLLAMSGIIYSFTLAGVAKYRGLPGVALTVLLFLSTLLVGITGFFYFFESVGSGSESGYATLKTLVCAATSLFWNLAVWFIVVYMKVFGIEIAEGKDSQ